MTTRYKALASASLALALALTGCTATGKTDGPTDPSTSTASTTPASDPTTPAPATSTTAPASDPSTPAPATSSTAAAAQFAPITSDAPTSDQEAQIKAFDALKQHYAVVTHINRENKVDPVLLGVTMREPYLSKFAEQLKPIETAEQTYAGESKIELLEAIIGGTGNIKGEQTPHATAQLRVCEDNTGVVVKDKDGKRVSSGSVLRYQVVHLVTWQEDDHAWKVISREVPRTEDGSPKTC